MTTLVKALTGVDTDRLLSNQAQHLILWERVAFNGNH